MNWLKTIITLGISTAVSAGLTVTVNANARETAQHVINHTQAALESTLVQVEESANTLAVDLSAQFGANASASSDDEVSLPPSVTITTNTSADATTQANTQDQANGSETTNASANVDASAALDSQAGIVTSIGSVSVDTSAVTDVTSGTDVTVDQKGASVPTDAAANAAVGAAGAVTAEDPACDANLLDSLSGWLGLNQAKADATSEAELKCNK